MKRLVGLACIALFTISAGATTVDFDHYRQLDRNLYTVSTQGLTFNSGYGSGGCGRGCMYVWDGNAQNSNGTPGLLYGYGSPLTIAKTGGGIFNLRSFEMSSSFFDTEQTDFVSLVIHWSNRAPTTEVLPLYQGLRTYVVDLVGFSSVSISEVGSDSGYWLMDDVNFNTAPEPGSLLLLGTGLMGVAAFMRRKLRG